MSDLDLSFTREKEDVGDHFLSFFGGGGDHHRGGVFEGASVRIWVEKAGGGDLKAFGIEDSGLEVEKQPLRVAG